MFSPTETADNVSRWTAIGVTLPKELASAIETFETLRYVETGRLPVFNLESVTAKNAEELVRGFAEELAVSGSPDANGMGTRCWRRRRNTLWSWRPGTLSAWRVTPYPTPSHR